MPTKTVYSVCGMCSVRCPIMVEVEDDKVRFIQGNPHDPGMAGGLCPRGGAGYALLEDHERPQYPMIREGARGEGKWRRATWDEALDYVADKLKGIIAEHGGRSVLWSDRGGPFADLHKAFMRGIGSPNYCNHDASCARNVLHAAKSVMGLGRKGVAYDLKNAKHIVLQTRNLFEAINVKEVNGALDSLANGGKLTVIDIRATVSASKADNFFMIRPGTDYGFNLAVIRCLLANGLYDKAYAERHIKDLDRLEQFVEPYTLEWAEAETGVKAADIEKFVKELAKAAPAVIWHPGWMVSRYMNSFYVSRTAYIINALLGSIGAKGGLPIVNKPKDFGRKGLKAFADLFPKPEDKRADGAGWKLKHIDAGPGLINKAYEAIESGDPYPVKAYFIHRHDPLHALPDQARVKKIWENLDLIVATTFSWSDSSWHADVVLPMSTYLERESPIATKNGLKSFFFRRSRSVSPRYDTRADWEILGGLAKRLGFPALAFETAEDMWNYQLQDTGVSVEDFDATGQVWLTDKPKYRSVEELSFTTPSGKLEMICDKLEEMGLPSLKPYESPASPPDGRFRIAFGRCALHTQGHTVNNPVLNEQMPINPVWINTERAKALGIADGDEVELSNGSYSARTTAFVTNFIHPDAAFLVHGFGHKLPPETRSRRGIADQELMEGGLSKVDPAGGGVAMQEHFITIAKPSA
ncbi:thiosulfate reductase/polysulfide reductase chain A [Desulfobaculum xiamenense]|uniref:Thiosulfate reductase/polysulfide reductase chain A n=1 Tax=Desulfobaculum xiamenense TaxID=995050 RepID=A0A846QQM4_9BACT|nr:molybdopterin-dependent oxidoreductase [Desulfobaculum xiamenense]NJB67695.1 thiosulfate reductase/polysulfide reductase chain A [Desulfobaculum xiamenense]